MGSRLVTLVQSNKTGEGDMFSVYCAVEKSVSRRLRPGTFSCCDDIALALRFRSSLSLYQDLPTSTPPLRTDRRLIMVLSTKGGRLSKSNPFPALHDENTSSHRNTRLAIQLHGHSYDEGKNWTMNHSTTLCPRLAWLLISLLGAKLQ